MILTFTDNMARWRTRHPLFAWLLVLLLGLSSVVSAGHIHIDDDHCHHVVADCDDHDTDHHEHDQEQSFDQDHQCSICQLADLTKGAAGAVAISTVYQAGVYYSPCYQTAPRGPPIGLFQARAPPVSL